MNREKHNNFTKLKKKHVWPSILLFLIYIIIVRILMTYVITLFTESVVETKFMRCENEVESFGREMSTQLLSKYDDYSVLSYLENNQKYHTYAMLNSNDTAVYYRGDITADLTDRISYGKPQGISYYYDKNSKNKWFTRGENYDLPFKEIVKHTITGEEEIDKNWMDCVVYSEPYWARVPAKNAKESILLKCNLTIYRKDLIYVFGLFGGIGILLMVPIIILIINMFSSVVTQKRMYHVFYFDPITGGKNWTFYLHYGEKFLTSHRQATKTFAIVDLQLEKYRGFCACNGVSEGEKLLSTIANVIENQLGKNELCAHYAKSNFALLISCIEEEHCKQKIQELIYKISEKCGNEHMVFHAGIYMLEPEKGENGRIVKRNALDIPQIYNYANEARATIEESEESGVAVFDQQMLDEQRWEQWVENSMERAMKNHEFAVYLQPKYNPTNHTLVGAEALVRWINPKKGLIAPYRFIPIFEHNGFINKLDDYMISNVAKEQARWMKEGKQIVPISVNVSRMHFASEDLAEHLASLVDEYKVPHELIEIELTESAFFDNKKILLHTLNKLKEFGFDLAMDDFGSGYSSLNSLKDLPLDVLKIDSGFFRGENASRRGEVIVEESIRLAKLLNMRTVAEGIETKEQTDFLAKLGCDMIQGFYYAKPMPIMEFEELAFTSDASDI